MNLKKALYSSLAVSVVAVGFVSCGGSKTAAAPQSSGSAQAAPATQAQASSANRGVKLEREECEEKSMEAGSPPREFGIGVADDEAFAINLALLDARSKLAQQLETMITGAIENFNQKYRGKDGAASSYNKATQLQQAYFEQFLQNTRPICKNTYVKENGDFNVYVTLEIDEGMMAKIHNKMTEDGELEVDFKVHQFKEEVKEMREKYKEGKKK